jgi:uncharacterized protein (DUF2141 family)
MVSIGIEGLRSTKGYVLICLTTNPRAFPDCSKDSSSSRTRLLASDISKGVRVDVNHAGGYAISVVHDENSNGKLDTAMMIPREGFGFSRNPRITFGPPKFSAAEFLVNGDTKQVIKVKYML